MKTIKEIKKGDIVTYRCGRVNNVNKPYNYIKFYNKQFQNIEFSSDMDIMKIQRYIKILCFYKLKTIYERSETK